MGMNDADLRFKVALDDDVSAKVEKLEAKLKRMGATPAQIRMIIRAQDETEPQLKKIRKNVADMSKSAVWKLQMNTDMAMQQLKAVRKEAEKPVKMTFVHNLEDVSKQLADITLRSRIPIPFASSIPGGNILAATGIGAAAMAPIAGAAGLAQQGVQINSQMEQSQVTLNQTLKDNTAAVQEMAKLVQIAKTTPFNYQDVLQADVRLRSYNIPTMKGEGGPQNQGWLKPAGDMAAAMSTPITQAVEAIADARQGYFVRMMSYGIRMMKEDFQPGGKYAGMTYEQGVGQAIRRFEGAQEAQSKTFKGIMSNIGDVVQQTLIRPIGAVPFGLAKQSGQNLMTTLQSNDFQEKSGRAIENVSHKLVEMYDKLQQGKQWFEQNLLTPLITFGKQVVSVGATFAKAFAGPLLTALKTIGTIFASIAKPVMAFVDAHPKLVQMYATWKALSLLGLDGPTTGISKMMHALNPLHLSITGVAAGFSAMVSGTAKLGIAALVTQFTKAARSADQLKTALSDVKKENQFKDINAELSRMALGLDTNTSKMKQLGASAIQGLKPGTDPSVGIHQAKMAQVLSQYGINANDANSLMSKQGIGSNSDVDKAAVALRQLAAASDVLKMSFTDSVRVMNQFGGQAGPIGLGGLSGAPYLAAINSATHAKSFGLNKDQMTSGIYTSDALMSSMMGAYRNPSVDQLQKLGPATLNSFFKFSGNRSLLGPMPGPLSTLSDVQSRYRANVASASTGQNSVNALVHQAGMSGLKIPSLVDPSIVNTVPHVSLGGSPANQAMSIAGAQLQNAQQLKNTNALIDQYTQKTNDLNKALNQWSQAQDALGNVIQQFNHDKLQPLQQGIEDAQLAMAQYQNSAMRPLERQMQRLGDQSTILANQMNKAQYSMSVFNGGLIDGEQAALNQLHALEQYNRQLQILQLQMQTMGAQLGQTTYDGATAVIRVNPLSQVSTEGQMQMAARKQQLAQLQYDAKYGEGHYKMDQAARSSNETREMSLSDRLKGIKSSRTIIDSVTVAQQKLADQQGAIQEKVNKVNEVLADQQDNITGLSLALQDKQLHGGLREMQEAQYQMGQKTFKANQELTKQNTLLAAAQDRITDYRDMGKALSDAWSALFSKQSPADAAKALTNFAGAVGLIDSKQKDQILKALAAAGGAVNQNSALPKDKTDWIDTIQRAIKMAFTGDLFRLLGDQIRNSGGPLGGIAGGNAGIAVMTAGAATLGVLTMVPLVVGTVTEVVKRGLVTAVVKGLPGFGKLDELAKGVGSLGMKIPGVRGMESVEGLASGGIRSLTNTKFLEILKDSVQFIKRFRGIVGGIGGAAIGTALLGPLGGFIGGIAGTKYGRSKTVRDAAGDLGKIVSKAKSAGDDIRKGGSEVAKIGKEAAKIGEEAKKIRLRGVGTFVAAVTTLSLASEKFGKIVDRLLPHLPKVPSKPRVPGATPSVPDGGHVDVPGGATKAVGVAGRSDRGAIAAAQKYLKSNPAVLKVLKGAGVGLDAAFLAQLGDDVIHGKGDAIVGALTGLGALPGKGGVIAALKEAGIKAIPKALGRAGGFAWAGEGVYDFTKMADAHSKELRGRLSDPKYVSKMDQNTLKDDGSYMKSFIDYVAGLKEKGKATKTQFDEMTKLTDDHNDIVQALIRKDHTKAVAAQITFNQDLTVLMAKYRDLNLTDYDTYNKQRAQKEEEGWKGVSDVFGKYSKKNRDDFDKWTNQMMDISGGSTNSFGGGTGSGAATHTTGGSFASGTANLAQHILKGKGDSKGYLIRVGEESDEAIIPLAPHRRDRARSLMKQLAPRLGMAANGTDGAYLAARKAVMGFASGGFTKGTGQFTGPFGSLEGMAVLAAYANKHFGLTATAGRTNHTEMVAGSNRISDHSWGGALDLSNGVLTPQEDAFANYAKTRLGSAIKQLIWRDKIIAGSGLGAFVAGHENHVHIAMQRQFAASDETMAKLLGGNISAADMASFSTSGGGGGGSSFHLGGTPRKLLKMGPKGMAMFHALAHFKKHYDSNNNNDIDFSNVHGSGGSASANEKLGQRMAAAMGWRGGQWSALDKLWMGESNWNANIMHNPSMGWLAAGNASGIPQADGHGQVYRKGDARAQIAWGLNYIKGNYGNPINAYSKWLSRNPHWYAAGKGRIENDQELAVLHRGEKVLNPAQASAVDDTKNRNMQEWTASMAKNIEKLLKETMHANAREDKPKDKDLSALNKAVKASWGQTKYAPTSPSVKNMKGDASEGEGTVAKVANETREFHIQVTADIAKDNALVKQMTDLTTAAKALQKSADTHREKVLANKAVASATTAKKAATTARNYAKSHKSASTALSRNKYVVSAAKRGVNEKLIKNITGKGLTGKAKKDYETAAKAKTGSKAQDKALTALRKDLTKGLSAQAKKLDTLRTTATKDASKARKDFAAAARSQIKSISSLSKGSQKTLAELKRGHTVSKTALSKLKSEVTKSGATAKAHLATSKDNGKDGKDNTKTSKKADDKRTKAEVAADKRERDHYKKMEDAMEALLKKPTSVHVTNKAVGATINTTVRTPPRPK